ncbi:MAG: AhpC/TSA family protein, partial [Sphingobacteriaceae bacterium]
RAQSDVYKIEGKLAKVKPGATAYVRYIVGKTAYSDSAQVHNGRFLINGMIDQPHYAWLSIDRKSIRFYLEPGTISVSSPDSIQNAVVGGSPMNTDNQKLKEMLRSTNEELILLEKEYQIATPDQKKSKEFRDSFEKRNDALFAQQNTIKAQFVKEHPTSMLSLFVLQQYTDLLGPEFSQVEPLFSGMSGEIKTSKPGKEYAKTLALLRNTSVGALAPEFVQADTSGKPVSLSSFRGKYVLVDFWASWCVPCRAENPNLVKNFQQYKDKNFTVLGVSLDRPNAKEAWLKAIHKDGLDWTQVSDLKFWDNEVAKQYAIRLIPQNFLIGPDGKILAKNIRGDALGVKLAELFTNKP